jgi:hypothetical protein
MFINERGAPFTVSGFQKLVARAGEAAGLGFPVHPHMLAMPAASSWPMTASIPGHCRLTSGIARSSTR